MTAGSVAAPTIIPLKVSHGQPKHVIDSATRIELASDTADTVIYYTLDKSRPNPSQKHVYGDSKTHRYQEPFTVSPGKVTIKAMACSQDHCRESAVVTKSFTVLKREEHSTDVSDCEVEAGMSCESPSKPPSISEQFRQRLSMGSRGSMLSSDGGLLDLDASPTNLHQASLKSLGHASTKSGQASGQSTTALVEKSGVRPETVEIPEPVCLYCKCPRPKNSDSHQYCTHCGSHLPPLPDMEATPPLQVAVCSNCRAHLPMGSTSCVVCEHTVLDPTPIPLIQAQAHVTDSLQDKVVCLICGTRNRPGSSHCWTCEKPLQANTAMPSPPKQTPPPLPNPTVMRPISGSTYMMCGVCGRVNVSDARFCDWCGSKPAGSQLMVECISCQTPNEWHCRYCSTCGSIIKAPLRPDVELSSTMKMPSSIEVDKNAWIPVLEIADKGPDTRNAATQTDGIFYPSARTIGSQKGSEFIKKMIHITARDRLPKLHTYSPGKGLWRMQVEHVCTHLRTHSQSSTSFQSEIGKPQLGKLISAEIKDEDNMEKIELHLTFALKQLNSSGRSLRKASSCSNISTTTTHKDTPTSVSAQTTPRKKPTLSKAKKQEQLHKRSHSSHNLNALSGNTKKLCKELLSNGQGRKEIVNSLLEKGADVNAVSPDSGLPMLSLATCNGHLDCIATLVAAGAKLDAQTKATGNTALHEAVLQGVSTIPCIEALLGHGANARIRNGDGLTPCDLAMRLKHDEIVTCFATYVGAGLLDNLYKYQPSLTL